MVRKLFCSLAKESARSRVAAHRPPIFCSQWWILGEAATSGPPFFELSRGPPLQMACVVLGYFVAF